MGNHPRTVQRTVTHRQRQSWHAPCFCVGQGEGLRHDQTELVAPLERICCAAGRQNYWDDSVQDASSVPNCCRVCVVTETSRLSTAHNGPPLCSPFGRSLPTPQEAPSEPPSMLSNRQLSEITREQRCASSSLPTANRTAPPAARHFRNVDTSSALRPVACGVNRSSRIGISTVHFSLPAAPLPTCNTDGADECHRALLARALLRNQLRNTASKLTTLPPRCARRSDRTFGLLWGFCPNPLLDRDYR